MSRIRGVYAISSPAESMLQDIESAFKGGVDIFQYRDKHSSPAVRKRQAQDIKTLCDKYGVVFIINDDIDLALDVDADGVHLGRDDGDIRQLRTRLGDKILGVSCYNQLELALEAQQAGADYVAFGRFFSSRTKPDAVQADIDLLHRARRVVNLPIVVIGGIRVENASQVIGAGADAIAVIDGIFGDPETGFANIEARARALKSLFTCSDRETAALN